MTIWSFHGSSWRSRHLVRSSIRENKWTVSIDIQDAYLYVPVSQPVGKYLRFMVNNRVYQFMCLLLGLATSPQEFTKLLQPVVQLLWLQGVKVHVYLDDWLIHALSPIQTRTHADLVLRVLRHLRLDDPCQQVGFVTQPACSSICVSTPWHPCPKCRSKSKTLWITGDHTCSSYSEIHRSFGHVDLHGQPCAKMSAPLPPNPVVGVRGLVPGGGSWFRQDFSDPNHSPSGGLVGLPYGAAGVSLSALETEITHSLHLQSWMGSASRLPQASRDVVPAAGKSAYQSVWDGGSASEYSWLPASTQVLGSAPACFMMCENAGSFRALTRKAGPHHSDWPTGDLSPQVLWLERHQACPSSPSRITQHPGQCSVVCTCARLFQQSGSSTGSFFICCPPHGEQKWLIC